MKDDDRSPFRSEPHVYSAGELADDVDLLGLARRFESHVVRTNVTLEQILSELRAAREQRTTERDRVDALERDFVKHREQVDDLTQRRQRAARKK